MSSSSFDRSLDSGNYRTGRYDPIEESEDGSSTSEDVTEEAKFSLWNLISPNYYISLLTFVLKKVRIAVIEKLLLNLLPRYS